MHSLIVSKGGACHEGRLSCQIPEIPLSHSIRGNGSDDILHFQSLLPHRFDERCQHRLKVGPRKGRHAKDLSQGGRL
jgi:hypothetical protein